MAETVTAAAPSRGRPNDPGLQARFIDSALELLAERGYRALTTAAIAKRAGASTASLYRRWSSKQELVTDIARTLTLDALGDIDTGTLEGDLRELISRKRALMTRVGTPLLVLLAEATSDDELREILRPEVIDATSRHLAGVLDRASARGEVSPPTPTVLHTLSRVLVGSELVAVALPAGPNATTEGLDIEVTMILRVLTANGVTAAEGGDRG